MYVKGDTDADAGPVRSRLDSVSRVDDFHDAAQVVRTDRPSVHGELMATLSEVSDVVSSNAGTAAVLSIIVERAKSITDTDKALLVLAQEHGRQLDLETVVVRGARDEHGQEWWGERLQALGDVAFELGEPVVDVYPREAALILGCPLHAKDRPIGLLCMINSAERPFTRIQVDFAEILSAFAASAIENARLAEQARHVLLASERDRIAREMHDGVVQSLFAISLGLEVCKKRVAVDPAGVAERLNELQEHLNVSMTELRRFIYDLNPAKLAQLGLAGALDYWVGEVTKGRPVKGSIAVATDLPPLDPALEASIYRIAKEAVSNVVRHASASSFEVSLESQGATVTLRVSDNGTGFDARAATDEEGPGLGLRSIRDRVARAGGTSCFESSAGQGTVLTVSLPIGGYA